MEGLSIWVCLIDSHEKTNIMDLGEEYHRGDVPFLSHRIGAHDINRTSFFYWTIVDLQYCVSFRCMAK